MASIASEKWGYRHHIFFYFGINLSEVLLMSTHSICFQGEKRKKKKHYFSSAPVMICVPSYKNEGTMCHVMCLVSRHVTKYNPIPQLMPQTGVHILTSNAQLSMWNFQHISYFSNFSQKTDFGISCKLETICICMKCQILSSGKNKKNIINLSTAEYAQRMEKVKYW